MQPKRARGKRGQYLSRDVYTNPRQVPGVMVRGSRGSGQCPSTRIKLKKGAMTKEAIELGYIDEGQTISDIPKSKMDDLARDLEKKVGHNRAMGMVNSQINLRANQRNGFKTKMKIAKEALRPKKTVVKVRRQ